MTEEKPSRGRTILVATLGVLACVAITISVTAIWVHQTVLDTDRYVAVVSRVAADPEVVEEISTNLADRVGDRILDRVELPPVVEPLLKSWIQEQIARFMESDAFADGWATANRAAHSALVRILRSDAVLGEEPVTISVGQLLVIAVARLQDAGVIPDDVELPDASDSAAVEAVRQILAERLDIEIPPGFGEITLVRSERLETARQVVRIFDIVTVASVLVALALVALTIWLARNRLQALLLLGIGAAVALLVAAGGTSLIGSLVVDALAEAGATSTIGALVNALLGDLASALVVVILVGAVITLGILYVGRQPDPAQMMALASPAPVPWAPPAAVEDAPAPAVEGSTDAAPGTPAAASPTSSAPAVKPAKKPTTKRARTKKEPPPTP